MGLFNLFGLFGEKTAADKQPEIKVPAVQRVEIAKPKVPVAQAEIAQPKIAPSTEKEIFMLGLPNAGKTVLFCVAMDLIQKRFNRLGDEYVFAYPTHAYDTQDMVSGIVHKLNRQEWPANTDKISGAQEAVVEMSFPKNKRTLISREYGGEVFRDVFVLHDQGNSLSAEETKVKDEFLKNVRDASSVALLIDSAMLDEGINDEHYKELYKGLFYMVTEIKKSNRLERIALIFTKNDIAQMTSAEAKEKFMDMCPNIYAHLKSLKKPYEFFTVSAVECIINENGKYIPVKGYSPLQHSKNVEDVMYWLLEMPKPA